jgi:SPOR domain
MAAAAAVVGLVAGILLGFSSSGRGTAAQAGTAANTSTPPTTRPLPEEFFTVVLASKDDRAAAVAAQAQFRRQGVRDAAILRRTEFPQLGTAYAVYSGLFATLDEARAHEAELESRGDLGDPFSRHVTR